MIADLLPLIIGAALLPAWIIIALLLLRGEDGVMKAAGFAAGAMAVRRKPALRGTCTIRGRPRLSRKPPSQSTRNRRFPPIAPQPSPSRSTTTMTMTSRRHPRASRSRLLRRRSPLRSRLPRLPRWSASRARTTATRSSRRPPPRRALEDERDRQRTRRQSLAPGAVPIPAPGGREPGP